MTPAGTAGRKPITDAERLSVSPFEDRDVDIRCHSARMVTVRKPRLCHHCGKEQAAGSRMYYERAIVDGEWCSAYMCLDGIDHAVLLARGLTEEQIKESPRAR